MNSTERIRQPWMHDMKPLVVAPAQLWETADGTVDASQQHAGQPISPDFMWEILVSSHASFRL